MMKKNIAVAALLFSFVQPHSSHAEKPIQFDFKSPAGSVEFHATGHPHLLHVNGKGVGPTGRVTINKTTVNGELVFDLTSLDTGIQTRDEHMKEKYLEVGKYPKSKLAISNLTLPQEISGKSLSITTAPFQGVLSLHGVDKSVSGTFDFKQDNKGVIQFSSDFSIKLSDFGIQIPSFSGVTIADDVKIDITSTLSP